MNTPGIRIDYRIIIIVLLLVIAGMLVWWKPWHSTNAKDRTIDVTGQATVSATPDEFVFSPTYNFINTDEQQALKDLSAKSDELTQKLKALGVPDSGIATNSSNWAIPLEVDAKGSTYTLSLTVTVDNLPLAQKVQDYLLTTSPSGTITPQATFSDSKQHALQNQARDQATKDARAKADQSARNLGFKVGAVKSVDDSAGFGGGIGFATPLGMGATKAQPSLTIEPGQNKLSYSVTVTYYIK